MRRLKYKMLAKGLVLDAIGMVTMAFPGIGTLIDFVWAPIAAWQMKKMYPGKKGGFAALVVFLEELIPGLDFIPTFTLMWIYTHLMGGEDHGELRPIKVRANN